MDLIELFLLRLGNYCSLYEGELKNYLAYLECLVYMALRLM